MRPTATDAARSMVCVSVSLCVGNTGALCKNGWTDRDAVWVLTRVGPRNHVLDGVEIPYEKGQFAGCPAHRKALRVSAAVYAAKRIIRTSITAWQWDCCSRLQYSSQVDDTLHCPHTKICSCDAILCQFFFFKPLVSLIGLRLRI